MKRATRTHRVVTTEQLIAEYHQEKAEASLIRNDPQACATALWKIACGDTGGGRAASALLLSLWNCHFAANMRDVMGSLDLVHSQAAIGLLEHMGGGCWLERYLTEDQMWRVIQQWGDHHVIRRDEA